MVGGTNNQRLYVHDPDQSSLARPEHAARNGTGTSKASVAWAPCLQLRLQRPPLGRGARRAAVLSTHPVIMPMDFKTLSVLAKLGLTNKPAAPSEVVSTSSPPRSPKPHSERISLTSFFVEGRRAALLGRLTSPSRPKSRRYNLFCRRVSRGGSTAVSSNSASSPAFTRCINFILLYYGPCVFYTYRRSQRANRQMPPLSRATRPGRQARAKRSMGLPPPVESPRRARRRSPSSQRCSAVGANGRRRLPQFSRAPGGVCRKPQTSRTLRPGPRS